MKTVLSFLFIQKLTRGNNKKFKNNFKTKNAPSLTILKNLGLIIYLVVEFIVTSIYKIVAPEKVTSKNVINFENYKLKKSQRKSNVIQFYNKSSKLLKFA